MIGLNIVLHTKTLHGNTNIAGIIDLTITLS